VRRRSCRFSANADFGEIGSVSNNRAYNKPLLFEGPGIRMGLEGDEPSPSGDIGVFAAGRSLRTTSDYKSRWSAMEAVISAMPFVSVSLADVALPPRLRGPSRPPGGLPQLRAVRASPRTRQVAFRRGKEETSPTLRGGGAGPPEWRKGGLKPTDGTVAFAANGQYIASIIGIWAQTGQYDVY
jgi:hypothetical protein